MTHTFRIGWSSAAQPNTIPRRPITAYRHPHERCLLPRMSTQFRENSIHRHPRPKYGRPLRYGSLSLRSRYLLSPLAGFTNLSFRRVVRSLGGVGLATTDLVNARGLLEGSDRTLQLIETSPDDRPIAVQIFGSSAAVMAQAAVVLQARGVDSVDINMGCPVERITKGGSGAGMMCRVDDAVELAGRVVDAVEIPVTVKMRLGWDETQLSAPRFAKLFEDAGVAAVAVHGRTRAQGFGGRVDLNGIRRVVESVERIPVIGNGDVRTVPQAERMIRETGCHGVSIGRGGLANPWIFRQLTDWEQTGSYRPAGSFEDRLQLLERQFGDLQQRHGFERAVVLFRKTAHWYLKGMRVRKRLRGQFQQARTREEFDAALQRISLEGPVCGYPEGLLADAHIPVPSGPIAHW